MLKIGTSDLFILRNIMDVIYYDFLTACFIYQCTVTLVSPLKSSRYPGISPKYLHIAGLFPVTPRDSPEAQLGLGVIPAVELALQHVNSHSRILPGIILNLTWSDTKVSCKINLL